MRLTKHIQKDMSTCWNFTIGMTMMCLTPIVWVTGNIVQWAKDNLKY